MKNLYIPNTDENLAELNSRYDLLFAAFTAMLAAIDQAKSAKSERINKGKLPDAIKDHALFYEREHVFFVAETKAKLAVKAMHPLLQPVWDACQKVRRFEPTTHTRVYEGRDILRSNVVVGENLYNQGCAIHFEHRSYSSASAVSELFKAKNDEPREWAVMKAAQGSGDHFHGSTSRDGSTPPPPPYMTKREANLDAWDWCEATEYDGGSATLYNVRTGRKLACTNPKSFTNKWGE